MLISHDQIFGVCVTEGFHFGMISCFIKIDKVPKFLQYEKKITWKFVIIFWKNGLGYLFLQPVHNHFSIQILKFPSLARKLIFMLNNSTQ